MDWSVLGYLEREQIAERPICCRSGERGENPPQPPRVWDVRNILHAYIWYSPPHMHFYSAIGTRDPKYSFYASHHVISLRSHAEFVPRLFVGAATTHGQHHPPNPM